MSDFGNDLAGWGDLDEHGLEFDGNALVERDLYHQMITPLGRLLDDPDYGLGVENWISEGIALEEITRKGALVEAMCLRDERVFSATAKVTYSTNGSEITISVVGVASSGPFKLIVDVGAAGAAMRSANNG